MASRRAYVIDLSDGGSALFMASICDLLGEGRVVTVDISHEGFTDVPLPKHPRIRYLLGSSTSEKILAEMRREAEGAESVLVVLDSDHSKEHVLAELEAYAPLVSKDSYLIVEDTNINGHPVLPNWGPGPTEAVEEFLAGNEDFVPDKSREKFFFTQNPGGFLKKVGP